MCYILFGRLIQDRTETRNLEDFCAIHYTISLNKSSLVIQQTRICRLYARRARTDNFT